MNIYIVDACKGKFSNILQSAWLKAGHKVKTFHCLHLPLYKWADVVYFDFVDSNAKFLSRYANGDVVKDGIPYDPDKTHVARCVDIDAYAKHPGAVDWTKFNACIFISEHIQNFCNRRYPNMKDAKEFLVRCGVDTEKYRPTIDSNELKNEKGTGGPPDNPDALEGPSSSSNCIDIGWVGRAWIAKNYMGALDILYHLIKGGQKAHLHVRSAEYGEGWWEEYMRHKIKVMGLEDHITRYDTIDDMAMWYREMDYSLVSSFKEAFSYAAGEAAACGVQPIVLNSPEMDKTWPADWLYNTPIEAADMMVKGVEGDPRQFILDNYPAEKHILETSKICGISL